MREPYQEVLVFLQDFENVPLMACAPGEADIYQSRVPVSENLR